MDYYDFIRFEIYIISNLIIIFIKIIINWKNYEYYIFFKTNIYVFNNYIKYIKKY